MNQPICPQCNGPMKLIPAGVSKKTGKPYDAFWGCKTYGCRGVVNINQPAQPAPTYAPPQRTPQEPYTPEQAKSQEIRGFQENKEESMRLMSSGRDATLMVTAMMGQGSAWTDEQLKDKIKEWQAYFYTKVYVDDPLRGK